MFSLSIYIYVITATVSGSISDNSALDELQRLHVENCGDLYSCSNNSVRNRSRVESESTCCGKCSCSTKCIHQGSCCLDFNFTSYVDETTFRKNAKEIRYFDMSNLNVEMNQEAGTCKEAKTFNGSAFADVKAFRKSYLMVDTCLIQYPKTISWLCFINLNLYPVRLPGMVTGIYVDSKMLVDLTLPVTSTKTNMTYKNKFCLMCNEADYPETEVIAWSTNLVCSSPSINWPLLKDDPYDTYLSTYSAPYSKCVLVFKPRPEIETIPTTCYITDVQSCPQMSNETLSLLCDRFYLPLQQVINSKLKTYKNIACFMCNHKTSFNNICLESRPSQLEYSFQLNLEGQSTLGQNRNIDYPHVDSLKLPEELICGISFYEQQVCSKTFCPQMFQEKNGTCVSSFLQVNGVFYSIILQATPLTKVKTTESKVFVTKLLDNLAKSARQSFARHTISAWTQNANNNSYFIVLVSLTTGRYYSYLDTIAVIGSFLEKVAFLSVTTTASKYKVTFDLAENIDVINGTTDRYPVDLNTGQRLHVLQIIPYRSLDNTLREVMIRRSFGCFRVLLERNISTERLSETDMQTKYMVSSDVRGDITYYILVLSVEDAFRNLANATQYCPFQGFSKKHSSDFPEDYYTKEEKLGLILDEAFMLIPIAFGISGLLVAILICRICSRRNYCAHRTFFREENIQLGRFSTPVQPCDDNSTKLK